MYQSLLAFRGMCGRIEATAGVIGALATVTIPCLYWPISIAPSGLAAFPIVTACVYLLRPCTRLLLYSFRKKQLGRAEQKEVFSESISDLRKILEFVEIISPGKILFRQIIDDRYYYHTPTSEGELRAISEINRRAFERTPYAGSYREKLRRNRRLWRRLPQSFLIVNAPLVDPEYYKRFDRIPICFSCILPLSQDGFQAYFVDHRARDTDFDPDWIAVTPDHSFAILIFTIAKDPIFGVSKGLRGAFHASDFIRAALFHLQLIQISMFPQRDVSIYLQNDDVGFRKILPRLGFIPAKGLTTANGETVYVLTLKAVPQHIID